MGDMSRKTTTRTWQRPQRPDSETRDPEGGVTDRRDRNTTDGPRPETTLTEDSQAAAILGNGLCTLVVPQLTNDSRAKPNGMSDGDGQGPSSRREAGGRGRAQWRSEGEPLRLQPSGSWKRGAAEAESQEPRRAAEGTSRLIVDHHSSNANEAEWEALLGDNRGLARSRSRMTSSSAGSGTERPSSRGRGSADQPGFSDPGSRSGSFGTHDGGHRQPWFSDPSSRSGSFGTHNGGHRQPEWLKVETLCENKNLKS